MLVRKRIIQVMFSFLALFMVLAAATGYHQLYNGPELARQAVAMRSKKVELKEYPRGDILDRNLISLTSSQQSQAVYFLFTRETSQTQNMKQVAAELSYALGNISNQQVLQKLKAGQKSGSTFVRIAMDLTSEQTARISRSSAAGLVVAPISKRYGSEGFCAHLTGYISNKDNYKGQAGLEKVYDDILQKQSSEQELVTVLDARGMAIQGLMFKIRQEQASEQGTVVLTIDRRVQQIVEEVIEDSLPKGAVVVLDIKTREILAMASRPAFDQNKIEQALQMEENSPLINRALNCYHPGSLFKILLAAAALAEEKVTLKDSFYCSGKININKEVAINCWQEEGHGEITFAEAFANSCNPAFIETGLKLGRADLLKYARQLKITDPTVIGYPDCQVGSFIQINAGQAALANASIGQQGVMITPLQIASLIATIADNGWYKSPSLVKYTVNSEGNRQNYSAGKGERVLDAETAHAVQKLMEKCISEGTGKSAALNEVMVAGKTATSQTGIIKENQEVLNAWFGGYLPADEPRWAIVVLVEEGRSGAAEAAPIFKAIARKLLPLYSSSY
ncbi:MAG TPA: penicillin-binding protein 2 [Syntrophomonadaceae bacterium]|nr:penicillin-binding protein 2 [Syntrophomonadaceae bacterium]HPR93137.1 penicillin-binding protein 2 [Syntrophomonadaceae bacterium]